MNKKVLLLFFFQFLFFTFNSAFGLSPSGPSAANDVRWQKGTCPVCFAKVRLAVVTVVETSSGVDADLFVRAVGPQPEFYLVNTCSACGFSGYLNDFELVIPKDLRERIRKTLSPPHPINPKVHQQEIDALDKYELAYQTGKLLGRTDEAFAWLCLRASWVARDLYCNLPKHPDLIRALFDAGKLVPPAKNTNPAERELAQAGKLAVQIRTTPPPMKTRWAYQSVAALLYRRHGRNDLAAGYIDRVLDDKNTPADIVAVFRKMKSSIKDERRWQTRAADHFSRALTLGTISPANKPIGKYLFAQLCVALDRRPEARRWLNEAILDPKLPVNLVQWAKEAQERIR